MPSPSVGQKSEYFFSTCGLKMVTQVFIMRVLFFLLFALPLLAIPNPIKTLEELGPCEEEIAFKVTTARVVLADYGLIRKDFRHLAMGSRKEIDAWLLENGGIIAKTQFDKGFTNNTNTEITVDGNVEAYRPHKYGRALVVKAGSGLIDIKGAGAKDPKLGSHSHGLGTLPEMIHEYMYEKLTHLVLKHHDIGDTIESYAVIDLGFHANEQEAGFYPAAQILRQAHVRERRLDRKNRWHIEQSLRRYGLSTAWFVDQPYIIINVQYSKERALVDFGCYFVTDKFTHPLVYKKYHETKDPALILNDPSKPDGIQPDPKLQVCSTKWNFNCYDNEFSKILINAKTPHELKKARRKIKYYLRDTLKDQQHFWEGQQAPAEEESRPAKKLCMEGQETQLCRIAK